MQARTLGLAGIALCLTIGWLPARAGAPATAPKLTVVTEEFVPYNFIEQGKLTGYSVELVRELLARTGHDYAMASYPWARAYHMAQQLPNVLIFSIARTAEREQQFQWIAPLARRQVYLYQLSKRDDITVHSLADLVYYKTAVNRDDVAYAELAALGLAQSGHLDTGNSELSSMRKLLVGRVDLIAGNPFSIRGLCATVGVPESTLRRTILLSDDSDYYLAASLATPAAVVESLRGQYQQLRGTPFLRELGARYQVTPL